MNFRMLFSTLFLMSTWTLSGQDWSLGMDMISLSKFIGGEETPVILQIRRSLNERHALRLNLGAYHSHKRRHYDYFNLINGVSVLSNDYEEVDYTYSGRLGWEYSLFRNNDRFRLYAFCGIIFEALKNKRSFIPYDSIPSAGIFQEEIFFYKEQKYDNNTIRSGFFLIPGVEINITSKLSIALETDISAWFYQEHREKEAWVWEFDWSRDERPPFFSFTDFHVYEEKGFQFRARALQYLNVRYTF